jgi:hypothetical protein
MNTLNWISLSISLFALYFAFGRNYFIWKSGYLQGFKAGYERGLRDARNPAATRQEP